MGAWPFISGRTEVSGDMRAQADHLSGEGKTPLLFSRGGRLLGMIAVADAIKPESPQAVRELQNWASASSLTATTSAPPSHRRQAGVDQVIAGVLPDGKESVIRSLQLQGKVAMVGRRHQ